MLTVNKKQEHFFVSSIVLIATESMVLKLVFRSTVMFLWDLFYPRFFHQINLFSRSIFPFGLGHVINSSRVETNDGSSPVYDNSNNIPHTIASSPSEGSDTAIQPSPLKEVPDNPEFEVGSMVEVDVEKAELYGVIRWIGPLHLPDTNSSNTRVMVGVELEDEPIDVNVQATDGTYNGVKYEMSIQFPKAVRF